MQEFGLKKSLPENIYLKACFVHFFFRAQSECLISDFHPEFYSGDVEGQQL